MTRSKGNGWKIKKNDKEKDDLFLYFIYLTYFIDRKSVEMKKVLKAEYRTNTYNTENQKPDF